MNVRSVVFATVFCTVLTTVLSLLGSCRQASVSRMEIIGGRPTVQDEPYLVQLVDSASSSEGFCGGTLVAPRIVVTAAHCIEPAQARNLHVVMGMADGRNLHLNHPIKVEGLVVHPDFDPVDNLNDIAVIYLEDYSDVEFERPVSPLVFSRDANLPEASTDKVRVLGLGNATSVGWIFDGIIREVELGVLPVGVCNDKYGRVDQTQICAGDVVRGGVDSCQGDSGGPMLAKDSAGAWVLVGIVSYGEGCAQKSAPGVYTRVAAFANFIDEAIASLTIAPSNVDEDVKRLLKTHCVAQFGYIPFSETRGDDRRETIYEMHLQSLNLLRSDQGVDGEELDQCVIKDHGETIEATWIRIQTQIFAANPKVYLRVKRGGISWISAPQTLHYREDNIHCQTSEGAVDLADLRNATYVIFKDVMYRLGPAADNPTDNQTTWGCSFQDASIEVYDVLTPRGKELAARIHHRSIGTVSVMLVRADKETAIFPRFIWSSSGEGRLVIENNAKAADLFTWKLACSNAFALTLADGQVLESLPAEHGSGFEVLVDSAKHPEGVVLSMSSVSAHLKTRDHDKPSGCMINDLWAVEVVDAAGSRARGLIVRTSP
jgi:trypsin